MLVPWRPDNKGGDFEIRHQLRLDVDDLSAGWTGDGEPHRLHKPSVDHYCYIGGGISTGFVVSGVVHLETGNSPLGFLLG